MRSVLILLAAGACGSAALAASTVASDGRAAADYQKLVAGKTPGKPVDCIDTRFSTPSLSAFENKLVYRVDRKLVWVSDANGGCGGVVRGDALVTRQYQTRLCRGDIAQTIDTASRMPTGSCALGAFTPWRGK